MTTDERAAPATDEPRHTTETVVAPAEGSGWSWCALLVFLTIWLALGAVLMTARVQHPGLEASKDWSDANILNAGRWFDEHGLRKSMGFPRLETAYEEGDDLRVYMSYPPGPFWTREIAKRIGLGEVVHTRVINQTAGMIAALLAFMVFARIARNAWIGVLGGVFYMMSSPFVGFSASLHHFPLAMMTMMAVLLLWLLFEDSAPGRKRVLWIIAACLAFFLNCWTSFGDIMVIGAFVAFRVFLPFRRFSRWKFFGAAALGLVPFAVFAMRIVHNGMLAGGLREGFNSLIGTAKYRSDVSGYDDALTDLIGVWLTRLGWPWHWPGHPIDYNLEFAYPILQPGIIAVSLVLLGVLLAMWRSPVAAPGRRAFWNGLLLFGGGLIWFALMTQHSILHRLVVLMILPGMALFLAGLAWSGFAAARAGLVRIPAWRSATVLLSCSLLAMFLYHLRTSDAPNQIFTLDEKVRKRILDRRESLERLERVGGTLSDVRRLYIIPWAPRESYALGVPFLFEQSRIPDRLGPDEGIYIAAWGGLQVSNAVDAMRRFGLPDAITAPPHRAMVFRGGGERGATLDFPFNDRLSITRMRWAETLDGEHVALTVRVSGELDRDLALRFNFALRAFDESGEEIASNIARIGWQHIFDDRDGRVVMMLPAEAVERAHQIRFRVWDNAESRIVPPEFVGRRPAWIRVAEGGREMAWNPRPPHPRRRPPAQTPDPQPADEPDREATPEPTPGNPAANAPGAG